MKPFLRILKPLLLAVVIGFVGYAIYRDLRSVDDWSRFQPQWGFVLLAALFIVGINVLQMLNYRHMLGVYEQRPSWRGMVAIAWIPPLGKYVPGKVAAIAGAILLLRRFGVSAAIAVPVVLFLDAFYVLIGMGLSTPILLEQSRAAAGAAIACVAVGVIVLHPRVFARVLNVVLKQLGREPLEHTPSLRHYLVPTLYGAAVWLFAGLSLWCMTRAFGPIGIGSLPTFICVQACAITFGYLALIAPGGLGVADGIRLVALKAALPHVDDATIAIIVVAMRLTQTLIELSLAGVGGLMLRSAPRTMPAQEA